MSSSTQRIDVRKVTGRRELHFRTLEEIATEVRRLAAMPAARSLGNWSPGQICQHLAKSLDLSVDGSAQKMPWILTKVFRLIRSRILNGPMKPGIQLPATFQSEFGPDDTVSDKIGFDQLLTAIERLKRDPHRSPSPAFGALTVDEWTKLHCRHAEMHLSFIVPGT